VSQSTQTKCNKCVILHSDANAAVWKWSHARQFWKVIILTLAMFRLSVQI